MAPPAVGKVYNVVGKGGKVAGTIWSDFTGFIAKGNVFDLAVGLVIGSAFTAIVTSLVEDIISPLISLATPGTNLNTKFVILRCPVNNATFSNCMDNFPASWTTPLIAQQSGAVTLNWGKLIQVLINFIIIAAILFILVKAYAAAFVRQKPVEKKECPYCITSVPIKATRCSACTSELKVEEETINIVEEETKQL
ncbi:hypothetical protein HK098_000563 [Nowakowskiella sp. JEL0407]|nr:hypothetical protein HK098_000563 [Nowakowskiella sp. JEL0407]